MEKISRTKYVKTVSEEEKNLIINNSVEALSDQPILSATEMKKAFVKPIVNREGTPSAIAQIDRVAIETEAALAELADGINTVIEQILQGGTSSGGNSGTSPGGGDGTGDSDTGDYVYYGVADEQTEYTADFVKGLQYSTQTSGHIPSFTLDSSAGGYMYYCFPSYFGLPTFHNGYFSGGFKKYATLEIGGVEYMIYRSTRAGLAAATYTIS